MEKGKQEAGSSKKSAVSPVLRDVGKLAAGVAAVATGSATGNPRNKCALQPGHSLMDWIRLGQSGRDLTGVGARAGALSVSPRQLAEHAAETDAWIAIRGKVYNITAYLPFHPGGPEELMRGAGKDATALFNQVHAWVNYESILQKCLVGRLTAVEPDVDTAALFYGTEAKQPVKPASKAAANSATSSKNVTNGSPPVTAATATPSKKSQSEACPRFDWIQKLDYITTIFYTKPFSNPEVQITSPSKQNNVDITLRYDNSIFTNHVRFSHDIHWPCRVSVHCETGKVEAHFRKIRASIWDSYGTLEQKVQPFPTSAPTDEPHERVKYIVLQRSQLTHNTCMLALQRADGLKQVVPVGKHVRVHGTWNGKDISRSYTPIPSSFMRRHQPPSGTSSFVTPDAPDAYAGDVCLLVKDYPSGLLSPQLCSRVKGDTLELTAHPLGSFDLRTLESREAFLLLAAGTGITPMLGLAVFLLARRIRRCVKVTLLFFNRKEEDILCKEHLEAMAKEDDRLTVEHVLSEPGAEWAGPRGHVSSEVLRGAVQRLCDGTQLFPADVFASVCGPTVFTNLARSLLADMGYTNEHMHCFMG